MGRQDSKSWRQQAGWPPLAAAAVHSIDTDIVSFGDHVVFVDESGDHRLEVINPDYPVFVRAFCVISCSDYIGRIMPSVRSLKYRYFGHDMVILREHEIQKRTGAFSRLNKEQRETFLGDLSGIIEAVPMTIIAVVIHKERHKARYKSPDHPYHLAMAYGLERVWKFLQSVGQEDKTTHVIFEARGAKEDRELELQFRRVCDEHNGFRTPRRLEVVIANKQVNSEGLQLTDLVARPIGLQVLRPEQPNHTWEIIRRKLWRGTARATKFGNGLKSFPSE